MFVSPSCQKSLCLLSFLRRCNVYCAWQNSPIWFKRDWKHVTCVTPACIMATHAAKHHLEVFENSTALVKTLWCVGLILIFTLQWGGEAGYRTDDNFPELWNIPSKAHKSLCTSYPSQGQTSSKFCPETGLPGKYFTPSVNQSHQASPATRQKISTFSLIWSKRAEILPW